MALTTVRKRRTEQSDDDRRVEAVTSNGIMQRVCEKREMETPSVERYNIAKILQAHELKTFSMASRPHFVLIVPVHDRRLQPSSVAVARRVRWSPCSHLPFRRGWQRLYGISASKIHPGSMGKISREAEGSAFVTRLIGKACHVVFGPGKWWRPQDRAFNSLDQSYKHSSSQGELIET